MNPPEPLAPRGEIFIQAGRSDRRYWRDLWSYRELLYFLAWRDILIRYKQAALGILWALLRPLVTMLVFTVIFGRLAKIDTPGDAPYAIFVFTGMLPWNFFATSLTESGSSVLSNSSLITKVYFPRLIAPASAVVVSFVDFLISFVLLAALMGWYAYVPTIRFAAVPVFALLAFLAALGAGLWLAALTAKYRDFCFILPFIVQLGFFVSPVIYPSARVPEQWRALYSLNPLVGIIDGFRWAILVPGTPLDFVTLGASAGVSLALVVSGAWFFRRMERSFADVI